MRTEYLVYLEALAKYRSINKASLQLHLTPQALSAALKQLEQEVGAQLMVRSRQGVELTEAGKQVVKSSKVILSELEQLQRVLAVIAAQERRIELSGRLNVMVTPGLYAIGDMPSVVLAFYKANPKVSTALFEKELLGVYQEMMAFHEEGDIVGIVNVPENTFGETLVLPSELEFLPLCQDCFMIFVSKSSPLAKLAEISLSEVVKYPLVMYQQEGNDSSTTYQILKSFGEPKIGFYSSNREVLVQALLANMGIGISTQIASRNIYNEQNCDLVAIPIKEKVTTQIGYLLRRDREDTLVIERFLKFFEDHFRIT